MSASVHKLLIHSSDIIESLSLPVGQLSEDVLEASQKEYNNIRLMHSRKTSRVNTNTILHWPSKLKNTRGTSKIFPTIQCMRILTLYYVLLCHWKYRKEKGKKKYWKNPSPSSTRSCRPISFKIKKENDKNTKDEYKEIDEQIRHICVTLQMARHEDKRAKYERLRVVRAKTVVLAVLK